MGDTGRAFPYAAFSALRGSKEGSVLLSKIRSGQISDERGLHAKLDAACRHEDRASCFALALLKHNPGGQEATAYLAPACDKGDLPACLELGRVAHKGLWSEPQDFSKAASLYERVCTSGHGGCSYLGAMVESGEGVPEDKQHAVELYQTACDGGEMLGCASLGVMYLSGKGVAKDENRAVDFFHKACDGGEMFGCASLGWIFDYGKGVAKDEKRAVELYQTACDGGEMFGCTHLAAAYDYGRGVARDAMRAGELYETA